jgi:hypothetical protein
VVRIVSFQRQSTLANKMARSNPSLVASNWLCIPAGVGTSGTLNGSIETVDTKAAKLVARIKMNGSSPDGIVLDPSGKRFYVGMGDVVTARVYAKSLIPRNAKWVPSGQSPEARNPMLQLWTQRIIACLWAADSKGGTGSRESDALRSRPSSCGHPPAMRLARGRKPFVYLRKTIRPATIVAMAAPRKSRPSKGVLRDLLGDSAVRKVHG